MKASTLLSLALVVLLSATAVQAQFNDVIRLLEKVLYLLNQSILSIKKTIYFMSYYQ